MLDERRNREMWNKLLCGNCAQFSFGYGIWRAHAAGDNALTAHNKCDCEFNWKAKQTFFIEPKNGRKMHETSEPQTIFKSAPVIRWRDKHGDQNSFIGQRW